MSSLGGNRSIGTKSKFEGVPLTFIARSARQSSRGFIPDRPVKHPATAHVPALPSCLAETSPWEKQTTPLAHPRRFQREQLGNQFPSSGPLEDFSDAFWLIAKGKPKGIQLFLGALVNLLGVLSKAATFLRSKAISEAPKTLRR